LELEETQRVGGSERERERGRGRERGRERRVYFKGS
jgi:hypothetical protein